MLLIFVLNFKGGNINFNLGMHSAQLSAHDRVQLFDCRFIQNQKEVEFFLQEVKP